MAEESDGIMVDVEDQPIDLSRGVAKKPMPPLIPISLLRSTSFYQDTNNLRHPQRQSSLQEGVVERQQWRENTIVKREEEGDQNRTRKRVRNESDMHKWGGNKLDRARSVPQLTPLTVLQRNKSLSESRIADANSQAAHTEDELQTATEMLNSMNHRQVNSDGLDTSWVYIGYYSQLLHRFQAQEMLRRFALHHDRDGQNDQKSVSDSVGSAEESAEMKRRSTRPLTGKHVRPGTGASPATLLSLRRKIQARRQQNDEIASSHHNND